MIFSSEVLITDLAVKQIMLSLDAHCIDYVYFLKIKPSVREGDIPVTACFRHSSSGTFPLLCVNDG